MSPAAAPRSTPAVAGGRMRGLAACPIRRLVLIVLIVPIGLALAVIAPSGATATPLTEQAGRGTSRDQELVGLYHRGPLSRVSLIGGLGYGSVRGGDERFTPSGRFAFDLGVLWAVRGRLRLGTAFNHFQFVEQETATGLDVPREISDVSAFVRLDGQDGRLTPYAELGGGVYFADNEARGDVVRAAIGLEVPVSRAFLRLEGRYTSYGAGAFLAETGRQSTLGVVFGARFPLSRGRRTETVEDVAERVRQTLRYIATTDERRELDAIEDPADLARYVETFWERRDPFPGIAGNPAREAHQARVALATERFGEMGRPGWASERGRAVIIHGQPDEVIWEQNIRRPPSRRPMIGAVPEDTGMASALELWIYYRALPSTDGHQSFFLYEEDAVSRYRMIWSNVAGESGYRRALPPLPPTIAAPISAVSSSY